MRIVIISNVFPPYVRGGAEQIAARTAKALAELGHEVSVITSGPARAGILKHHVEKTVWENLPVYRFFPRNFYFLLDDHLHLIGTRLMWHVFDTFNLHTASVVRKLLCEIRPDIVMTHNLKGIGLLLPLVIRTLGILHVHMLHDIQLVEPSGLAYVHAKKISVPNRWAKKAYTAITRWLFTSPALVVSPTRWLFEYHRSRGFFPQSKCLILENPSDACHVERSAFVRLWRETSQGILRVAQNDTSIRFVFVGQLELHKGIVELLAAFQEACAGQNFFGTLDIVGDGTLRQVMRVQVRYEDRIRMHGRLPKEKMMKILAGATALIFPSLCLENAPGAILDAFAVRVPVIASDVGGVGEFVKENQTGWLIEPGSVAVLRRAMEHAAEHPKEVQMLRERLAERKAITPQEYAEKLIDALR